MGSAEEIQSLIRADPITILRVLGALGVSIAFGCLVMLMYRFYHRKSEVYDLSISRSFPIIAPSVTSIFLMIQSSLPLSLGLLGALSFVRFRSPVKRAEDVGFILVIISGGIACAVSQYYVGFLLLAILLIYDLFRRFFNKNGSSLRRGNIALHSFSGVKTEDFTKAFSPYFSDLNLVSMTSRDKMNTFIFSTNCLELKRMEEIRSAISRLDSQARLEFFFPDNQLGM